VEKPIKILHIDPDYKVTYFVYRPGASIHSQLTLPQAIELLKTETFDLILSEPHNKAIMDPQGSLEKMDLDLFYSGHGPGISPG
jgi:hypothetical protein